jgi:hypothetical protein
VGKIRLTVVENPEPDPEVDRLLDQMCELSRQADTFCIYIGNLRED